MLFEQDNKLYKRDLKSFEQHIVAADNSTLRIAYRFVMSMMVSFVLSFFPRDVLDEILNLIESVSEDFPSYSLYPISDNCVME